MSNMPIKSFDNPYIYTITLNKDNIKYTIMSLIVYDKLADKTPIFTTSRGNKIYFKLCSEVISSMIRDHQLLTSSSKLKGLPEEYNLNIQNNMGFYKKEILKEAGDNILKQINKLVELHKIYKYPTKRVSRIKYAPTEYKLIALSQVSINLGSKTFDICDIEDKCVDCMDRCTDFLITTRAERQLYRKGKCLECPYNKR